MIRVLPPFDDRLPLVLLVGMGESVAPSAHHRKAVADDLATMGSGQG